MSLRVHYLPDHGQIKLSGKFIMEAQREFARVYRHALPAFADKHLVIHMGEVEYIDSSALGMLLMLHKDAKHQGTEIILKDCKPVVHKVLAMAQFDKLFAIQKYRQ
jgi:anti-anti-sigma factor